MFRSLFHAAIMLGLCAGAWAQATRPGTQPATAPSVQTNPVLTISASFKDTPAREVIRRFERHFGITLCPDDFFETHPQLPRVTLELKEAAFWQAFKEIGRQTGLEPIESEEQPNPPLSLGVGDGKYWKSPHAAAGPLLIFATNVSRGITVNLGSARHQTERTLSIDLSIIPQPGLRVLRCGGEVKLKRAIDDQNQSLLDMAEAPPADAQPAAPVEEGDSDIALVWTTNVALNCPPTMGKSISRLVGVLKMRIPTRTQRVEVADIAKSRNSKLDIGGVQASVRSLKREDDILTLAIGLKRAKAAATTYHDVCSSVRDGMVKFYDKEGREVGIQVLETPIEPASPTSMTANLRFMRNHNAGDSRAGEPFKLVWEAAIEGKDIPVEFELTNVPLPK